jgi:hypothetical protein
MHHVLLEALSSRSRHGLWLALQPTLGFMVLLVGIRTIEVLFPLAIAAPLGLLVTALWCCWAATLLPGRARKVGDWLQARVVERGGDGSPAQPVHVPSALEINARNAPTMLVSLEAAQLSFMRHPGRDARRVLALASLALWAQLLTQVLIEAPGTLATALTGVFAGVAMFATVDLYCGRRRALPRFWLGERMPWPTAWKVEDKQSKVLGPLWLAIGLLFFAATVPIAHAQSVEQGVSMSFHLSVPLTVLWVGRRELRRVGTIEQTKPHRLAARWLVRLAPVAWWSVLVLQVTLISLGIVALALSPVDESAAYLGVLLIGIAVMVRSMRLDWQRPRKPTVVNVDEVAALLGEPHLERRITLVLMTIGAISGIWSYLLEAT